MSEQQKYPSGGGARPFISAIGRPRAYAEALARAEKAALPPEPEPEMEAVAWTNGVPTAWRPVSTET